MPSESVDLVIVGQRGGTNVGASLHRAAVRAGTKALFVDSGRAWTAVRPIRILYWRLAGHRPPRLGRLSRELLDLCSSVRPRFVLCTGLAPIHALTLRRIGRLGTLRLNYLTDDPWNPGLGGGWFFRSLREYDHVFSVRRANMNDLEQHGCPKVSYIPFGFDSELACADVLSVQEQRRYQADVVFVGGADAQRLPYIAALGQAGFNLALYGDYWGRDRRTRSFDRGHADPVTIRKATLGASVALCMVRHANRDGQVMRSYETAAIGACMLVEDTPEHRELFGADGDTVVYFHDTTSMLTRLSELLNRPLERLRLARAVRQRILSGGHTYDDRLRTMLSSARNHMEHASVS
ncbi:MAG: glycosyltransferase [Chloroflexi bacterium]|nr:glycosyltransferase [Chloroflexota bacterium]